MRNRSLSSLGFIMETMDIQTVQMARALHVDASLISKWKTGQRRLTAKSVYFDDVIGYILEQSKYTENQQLKETLSALYPNEMAEDCSLETYLRLAITDFGGRSTPSRTENMLALGTEAVTAYSFEGNNGRREALNKLLDYAETLKTPGELIFIDSSEYSWLLEDDAFANRFTSRIDKLLESGFHAKFVVQYSSHKDSSLRLFQVCSSLIFHRSIEWYYYEYYDENFFPISFCILNRAISMLGISSGLQGSTMIYFDNKLALHHEELSKHVINRCKNLFEQFSPIQFPEVVEDIYHSGRRGTFYSYLPAPAFMSVGELLLREVLNDNEIEEATIKECLSLNRKLREITAEYFKENGKPKDPFVHIFQLEEMLKRIRTRPFESASLTLLGGKTVKISEHLYARELRNLADGLVKHDNLQIVLVSKQDGIKLPSINCWCKKNKWMVQMDQEGFRISEELSIVNAASITLEQCIHKIPPVRKEKESVRRFLLELADELEGN